MIIEKIELSLEKHIMPILEDNRLNPRWHNADDGWHDGIFTDLGYVTMCEGNALAVYGSRELAELLEKEETGYKKIYFRSREISPRRPNRTVLMAKILGA